MKKIKGEQTGRFARDLAESEDECDDNGNNEAELSEEYDKAYDHVEQKPSLKVRLKVAAKGRLNNIDTQKAQGLLKSQVLVLRGKGEDGEGMELD